MPIARIQPPGGARTEPPRLVATYDVNSDIEGEGCENSKIFEVRKF